MLRTRLSFSQRIDRGTKVVTRDDIQDYSDEVLGGKDICEVVAVPSQPGVFGVRVHLETAAYVDTFHESVTVLNARLVDALEDMKRLADFTVSRLKRYE